MSNARTSETVPEPRRRAPSPCGYCGRSYMLPRPRACCSRGREWDMKIIAARQGAHVNDKASTSSNERLSNVFATFTHEQLVQRCVSLSEALDAASLDSIPAEAQLLLGRVLAEFEPMVAKNVRLYRDIKAFLEGSPVERNAERFSRLPESEG